MEENRVNLTKEQSNNMEDKDNRPDLVGLILLLLEIVLSALGTIFIVGFITIAMASF